jgi:hypothetical protein
MNVWKVVLFTLGGLFCGAAGYGISSSGRKYIVRGYNSVKSVATKPTPKKAAASDKK